MPDTKFFRSQEQFRQWLEKHHDTKTELWVGFYKVTAKKKGLTYPEAVEEALCWGWIDGIRKGIDEISYTNRFSPRKKTSIWSNINIAHIERLTKAGRMKPSGIKAYDARNASRSGVYSFENAHTLSPAFEKKLKANTKAWKFFEAQAPWYKRTAIHWVMSAKQEATREKRLDSLMRDSSNQEHIKPLRRNIAPKK